MEWVRGWLFVEPARVGPDILEDVVAATFVFLACGDAISTSSTAGCETLRDRGRKLLREPDTVIRGVGVFGAETVGRW